MGESKFALVKWLDGDDKGKYTPGIPLTWIRDFDIHQFHLCEDPEFAYVVEWRCGKKPKGGWICYDVVVADISDRVSVLERKIKIMDGILSPKKVTTTSENDGTYERKKKIESNQPKQPSDVVKKEKSAKVNKLIYNKPATPTRRSSSSDSEEDYFQVKKRRQELDYISDFNDQIYSKFHNATASTSKYQNISGIKILDEKQILSNNSDIILEAVMKNQELIINLQERIETLKKCEHQCKCSNVDKENIEPTNLGTTAINLQCNMKEVGNNSGVYITYDQWYAAISKTSFTHMGISLLMSLFDLEVLLVSNLKGGSKKQTDGEKIIRKALNAEKLQALEDAVREQHKGNFNKSVLRAALNNKLSSLRTAFNTKLKTEIDDPQKNKNKNSNSEIEDSS